MTKERTVLVKKDKEQGAALSNFTKIGRSFHKKNSWKKLSKLKSGRYPDWMKTFHGGACPRTPLEGHAFGPRLGKRSVFILDPRLQSHACQWCGSCSLEYWRTKCMNFSKKSIYSQRNKKDGQENREGQRTNCWLTNLSSKTVKGGRPDSEWLGLIIKKHLVWYHPHGYFNVRGCLV